MATNVEITIHIRIRDSQQTVRTYKSTPIPVLKDQIAWYTGVSSNRQQLVFRGRDMRNDKRVSDYNVEDGDTLHLNILNLDGGPSSEPFVRPSLGRPVDVVMFQISKRENDEGEDFDRSYCNIHDDNAISDPSIQREMWRAFNFGNFGERPVYPLGPVIRGRLSNNSQQAFGQSYYVPMPNATGLSGGGEGSVAPENAGPQYTIPPPQDSSAETHFAAFDLPEPFVDDFGC